MKHKMATRLFTLSSTLTRVFRRFSILNIVQSGHDIFRTIVFS
jgi:hypothetical protein